MSADGELFRLHGDTILIINRATGSGVLYLLVERKMFCLQPGTAAVLEALEENFSLESVARRTGRTIQDIRQFVEMLRAINAGCFLPRPHYIEAVRIPDPLSDFAMFRPQGEFQRLHVYLTDRCTMHCEHCSHREVLRLKPCEGCGRLPVSDSQNTDLDIVLLRKTLCEAADLECQSVVFHVGDSAIVPKLLIDSLRCANNCGFPHIEIITGAGVHSEVLETIIATNTGVTFQVYSGDVQSHDSACGCPGMFNEISRSIQSLREAVKSFAFIYLADIKSDIGASIEKLASLQPQQLTLDRQITETSLADVIYVRTCADECMDVPDVVSYLFSLQRTCMYGQLFLGNNGCLYACPFVAGTMLGNLREKSLCDILSEEKEQRFWRDGVLTRVECNECQFRLACKLCSASRGLATETACPFALEMSASNRGPEEV